MRRYTLPEGLDVGIPGFRRCVLGTRPSCRSGFCACDGSWVEKEIMRRGTEA